MHQVENKNCVTGISKVLKYGVTIKFKPVYITYSDVHKDVTSFNIQTNCLIWLVI